MKCKILFPSKVTLLCLVIAKNLNEGSDIIQTYKILKRDLLKEAHNQNTKLGNIVVCVIEYKGQKYNIFIKRKLIKERKNDKHL